MSAMLKDVDCLLIAKPVATNYLGIRRDCAIVVRLWPVVGSSLQGPPSLLLDCDRGKRVPNCVRSGNKVFWPLVLDSASTFEESVPCQRLNRYNLVNENSQCRKLAPFWRSLVGAVACFRVIAGQA